MEASDCSRSLFNGSIELEASRHLWRPYPDCAETSSYLVEVGSPAEEGADADRVREEVVRGSLGAVAWTDTHTLETDSLVEEEKPLAVGAWASPAIADSWKEEGS